MSCCNKGGLIVCFLLMSLLTFSFVYIKALWSGNLLVFLPPEQRAPFAKFSLLMSFLFIHKSEFL